MTKTKSLPAYMRQEDALNILKLGHNVYLTGPAGSGKTHVLNQYIRYLKKHDVGVGITASTGIAATHMHGMTIHSWAGIGINDYLSDSDIANLAEKSRLKNRFAQTQVLVIDEVSMLHSFRLDLVDRVARGIKKSPLPFGGMQVILCGDFFQLPPITRGSNEADFVYRSQAWTDLDLKICYLQEQFRQDDDMFTTLLEEMRRRHVSSDSLERLMARLNAPLGADVVPTKLFTHNADVDAINNTQLARLPAKSHYFEMTSSGSRPLVESLIKSCLAPQNLELKVGAVVMFVRNDFERGYVNGTMGTVTTFDEEDDYPIVKTYSGKTITATPEKWSVEEGGEVLASISQIPLRLAWAITVHKSQGMSLDAAQINLSRAFVEGLGYVALSRVRKLSGIQLLGLNEMALLVSEEALRIDQQLREASEAALGYVRSLPEVEKQTRRRLASLKR